MSLVKNFEKAGRQTWLAGLGAFGTGKDLASNKFDAVYENANVLVSGLIVKGEKLEADLQQKIKLNNRLDEKVNKLKSNLGIDTDHKQQKLDELSTKVDQLAKLVTQLAENSSESVAVDKTKKTTRKATTQKVTSA